MPEDDDTNYTTLGLAIMKKYGRRFTPENVAEAWLTEMPILHTFTAERVAYRNLCLLIQPPASASYRNVHREWIGAQIRGDFWGYSCPGDPELAAEYAWRDASVSHVKNGIYGEMWAAAMIAHAFTTDDIEEIITAGLAQVPAKSRLAYDVAEMMKWHKEGVKYDDAVARIHKLWDENRLHDWCHTLSNARIVALALLWGGGDFGDSICKAVQPGFDTDCNGATVGSILGAAHGAGKVPKKWTEIFNDSLETGISGYHRVSVKEMAEETLRLAEA
jgi:ADP-ribosylglycohydrolase